MQCRHLPMERQFLIRGHCWKGIANWRVLHHGKGSKHRKGMPFPLSSPLHLALPFQLALASDQNGLSGELI